MRHEFGFCSRALCRFRDRVGLPATGGDRGGVPRGTHDPADRSGGRRRCRRLRGQARFEMAARWREKFEQLEWLSRRPAVPARRGTCSRSSIAIPGDFGDDRVYLVRQGVVRASVPYPATPIEREAFRAVVAAERPDRHLPGATPARIDRRDPAAHVLVPRPPRSSPPHDARELERAGGPTARRPNIGERGQTPRMTLR